jgi:hypothetical protein
MIGAARSRLLVALAGSALAGCALLAPPPPLAPFRDVNEVVAIERVGDRIRFETPNGELLFDPRDESWVVRATEQAGKPPERELPSLNVHDPRADALLPDWWPRPTAGSSPRRRSAALAARAALRRGRVHRRRRRRRRRGTGTRSRRRKRALLVTSEDVWIGHARGVTRVPPRDGTRSDYVALPASAPSPAGSSTGCATSRRRKASSSPSAPPASRERRAPVDLILANDAVGAAPERAVDDVHWRLTSPLLLGGRLYLEPSPRISSDLWG